MMRHSRLIGCALIACFATVGSRAQETAALAQTAPEPRLPLWRIPASELDGMRKKPLFSPSRRPPPVAETRAPASFAPVAYQAPPPAVTLVGVLTGPGGLSIALVASTGKPRSERVHVGDRLQEWTVTAITRTQIFLRADDRTITLALQPKEKIVPRLAANNPKPNQYGD